MGLLRRVRLPGSVMRVKAKSKIWQMVRMAK
jgi:hypothetical protein